MASPLGEIPTLNLSDSIQSKASLSCSCSCDKITVNEIPGAQLPRAPEKCKLSELRIWLKSRCQTVKSKETKAELCLRDISHLPAVKYGKDNEVTAVQQYASYMTNKGRKTKVLQSGCVINPLFPWLAATPDGIVYNSDVGYGLLEIKCSYTNRNITPAEACMDPSFFCSMVDGNFQLKKEHDYYAQVQGQLGICGATYCDFVVFTNKGLGIQRILFDENFWRSMVQKLRAFFVTDFAPVVRVLQKAI